VSAIAEAARRLGAVIETGTTVLGLTATAGRVTGVRTSAGNFAAGTVLCAAGAWSARLLRTAGVRLPVRWIRATAARTSAAPPVTELAVGTPGVGFSQCADGTVVFGSAAWSDYDIGLDTLRNIQLFLPNFARNRKMIQLHLNRVLAQDVARRLPGGLRRGAPFDWPRIDDPPPNRTKIAGAHRELIRIVPALQGTRMAQAWAGTVDVTPDALAVIGPVDAVSGLVLATGLSSHGFGIGPGVGRAVAGLITGDTPPLDLRPYRIDRFTEGTVRAHHHL
jgi:glycine/D-amino acid oxidase-like deaminating enzyme